MSLKFSTSEMKFDPASRCLSMYHEGRWPDSVKVVSSKTGREVEFVLDVELAIANEFWDGLQTAYKPSEECGVKNLFFHLFGEPA